MFDCFDDLILQEFNTIIHLVGLTHEVDLKTVSSNSNYYKVNVEEQKNLL